MPEVDVGSNRYSVRKGIIRRVDISTGTVFFSLHMGSGKVEQAPFPASWITTDGDISLGYPAKDSPILVVPTQGDYKWAIIGYDIPDSTNRMYNSDGKRIVNIEKLRPGCWGTLIKNDIHIIANPNEGVFIGDSDKFLQADPLNGIISSRFYQSMHFTDAHYNVSGPVQRDLASNNTRGVNDDALTGHKYDLKPIGLDPKFYTGRGSRNPTFTESRTIYYEFNKSYNYNSDKIELDIYDGGDQPIYSGLKRRESRADTLSLALDYPNHLIESVVGTVVDFYGNILDLNRNILPNGLVDSLSFAKTESNKTDVFKKLREQTRKSIAFHWELNARKPELQGPIGFTNQTVRKDLLKDGLQDIDNSLDYARDRSRFFIDIDKEGQFKINIPASSEVGNVSVLARYENFSIIKGAEKGYDRGLFLRNEDNIDIRHDQYGYGGVILKSGENELDSFAAPKDRLNNNQQITLGTAFHDLNGPSNNAEKDIWGLFRINQPFGPGGNDRFPESYFNNLSKLGDLFSQEIIVSGDKANAGGRSGTITMDGFLSVSIGANTIDRQSLWFDTAGGIIGAIGRDKNDRSLALSMDGDVIINIGNQGISDDSRFSTATGFSNVAKSSAIEIRVRNEGSFHVIRIEKTGMYIYTPQRLEIVAQNDLMLKSVHGNLYLDAENIYQYAGQQSGGRLVRRVPETI
jgi:hypothetical protein